MTLVRISSRMPWILPRGLSAVSSRTFSLSAANRLKEIIKTEKDGIITIEGVYVKSPREDYLIEPAKPIPPEEKNPPKSACTLCRLGPLADQIKHTDVLILSQFMKPNGGLLPRRISGLCGPQQRRMRWLVDMAKNAGLVFEYRS